MQELAWMYANNIARILLHSEQVGLETPLSKVLQIDGQKCGRLPSHSLGTHVASVLVENLLDRVQEMKAATTEWAHAPSFTLNSGKVFLIFQSREVIAEMCHYFLNLWQQFWMLKSEICKELQWGCLGEKYPELAFLPYWGKGTVGGTKCRKLGASLKMWTWDGIICFKSRGEVFCLNQIWSVEMFLFLRWVEFGYEQHFLLLFEDILPIFYLLFICFSFNDC